jgi:hypothetical protein
MNCPDCHQPIPEGVCCERGIFFETPVSEVHDLYTYNVQYKRDCKKLDHFSKGIESVSGEGDAGDT